MIKISVAAARVNAKLTQSEAAKQLNISRSTLQAYEKEKTYPNAKVLKAMCKVYGIALDDLRF